MKLITLPLVFAHLFLTQAYAEFAPQNDLNIPPPNQNALIITGIDEVTFNSVVDKVFNYYKPVVSNKNATLVFKKLWSDGTVNSDTNESGSTWTVNAYGGLARYPGMTADGYMLVLCHEMYHHLGGFPKYTFDTIFNPGLPLTHWASTEGQSDYGATLKCFRHLVNTENNELFATCGSGKIKECCKKPPNEAGICVRTVKAGLVLATVLNNMSGKTSTISLDTPDKNKVTKTFDGHPNAQCRADTYYAGAICNADENTPFSNTEPMQGSCSIEHGDKIGVRPACWYKPIIEKDLP